MANRNQPLYHEKVLTAVIDFLILSGLSIAKVQELTTSALQKARVRMTEGPKTSLSMSGMETIPAVVLHRWHRDPMLLDADANPKELKLYGSFPSVEALVKDEESRCVPRKIVEDMRVLGLVRERSKNRYVPKSRVATIATLHPVLIEHVAHSLLRLLETVERNVSSSSKSPGLIERFTHIPDLPQKEVPSFMDFSQEHGSAFLASVDDWLESRRPKRKLGHSCSAGIHVFAYVEEVKR